MPFYNSESTCSRIEASGGLIFTIVRVARLNEWNLEAIRLILFIRFRSRHEMQGTLIDAPNVNSRLAAILVIAPLRHSRRLDAS